MHPATPSVTHGTNEHDMQSTASGSCRALGGSAISSHVGRNVGGLVGQRADNEPLHQAVYLLRLHVSFDILHDRSGGVLGRHLPLGRQAEWLPGSEVPMTKRFNPVA